MLPVRGRVILTPHDDTTPDVPRVILPEDPNQAPIFIPAPVPVPPPTGEVPGRPVIDIRASLPHESQGPAGQTSLKQSLTFHWAGENVSRAATDAESLAIIIQYAYQHIRKNWGTAAAPAFGDTIMYHEVITPRGTVYVCRDYTEVAWHAGNDLANRTSRAILLLCGPDTPPTSRQLDAMVLRWQDFQRPQIFGHMEWSPTQCPGPTIMEKVRQLRA